MQSSKILFRILLLLIVVLGILSEQIVTQDENITLTDIEARADNGPAQIWGYIDENSTMIDRIATFRVNVFTNRTSELEYRSSSTRKIDGIKLQPLNNTEFIGELMEGGPGYNYYKIKASGLEIEKAIEGAIILYRNFTTIPDPEEVLEVWGKINANSSNFHTHTYINYPLPDRMVNVTTSNEFARTIDGMRLTEINNQSALYTLVEGGVGYKFSRFNFAGRALGRGYEFKIDFFSSNDSDDKDPGDGDDKDPGDGDDKDPGDGDDKDPGDDDKKDPEDDDDNSAVIKGVSRIVFIFISVFSFVNWLI